MGEQIRDKISSADCTAYAEACELWATRAPNDDARKRLLDMGRSWRELQRHLQASDAADTHRSHGKNRAAKTKKVGEPRARSARSES